MNMMQASVLSHSTFEVREIARPSPGPGEVLVKVLSCGICGSDLHFHRHQSDLIEKARALGADVSELERAYDTGVILGHEFVGEVVEYYDKTEVKVSDSANFTVTGTGSVSPEVISAVPSDWELYEGVLVTLGAAVTTDDPDQYGESPLDLDNDGAVDIYLDNYLYDAAAPNGTSFTSITGVVDYSYGSFRVMPRDASDLAQ